MFTAARRTLTRGVAHRVFPAAVIEVGTDSEVLWSEAFGRLTFDEDAEPARGDTIFDLASLTKVLSTTPLILQMSERGAIDVDDPVSVYIPQWHSADRAVVTIRDLLSHCSGLPAHRPYFELLEGRDAFVRAICTEPLAYTPRTQSIYSDLGFMLLGFILSEEIGLPTRLATLLDQMRVVDPLQFGTPVQWQRRTAPTSRDPWRGRLLRGEVEDENAAAVGGAAGHAGLFGTAGAVGACARHVLQVLDGRTGAFSRSALESFTTRRSDVPGSSRALGWDAMVTTSSCGTLMSPRAFGHTGFTGTSLWIDPEKSLYVALLTNRVYPDRQDRGIQDVRRQVHDAVVSAI